MHTYRSHVTCDAHDDVAVDAVEYDRRRSPRSASRSTASMTPSVVMETVTSRRHYNGGAATGGVSLLTSVASVNGELVLITVTPAPASTMTPFVVMTTVVMATLWRNRWLREGSYVDDAFSCHDDSNFTTSWHLSRHVIVTLAVSCPREHSSSWQQWRQNRQRQWRRQRSYAGVRQSNRSSGGHRICRQKHFGSHIEMTTLPHAYK